MKVTALVENTSAVGLPVEHGLSLFVEHENGKRLLFDMGQGMLFAENARRLNIDMATVDVAFISHGHYDHGGGLAAFLSVNPTAKVYLHPDAFRSHYSLREDGLKFIGLDNELRQHSRLVYCNAVHSLSEEMVGFSDVRGNCFVPVGNRRLIGPDKCTADVFEHEQNLLVREDGKLVLFAGCAHKGIVNILKRAEEVAGETPTHVFAGMHLVKSGLGEAEEDAFIGSLAAALKQFGNTQFFTMHCTGVAQYEKLRSLMGAQICYLSCGEQVCL